jgi:hypothetical protein
VPSPEKISNSYHDRSQRYRRRDEAGCCRGKGQPDEPSTPRRLRTWSRFGQIRRVPSEYEILTHDLNYTMREGRVAALESNPTTPANMWFLTCSIA